MNDKRRSRNSSFQRKYLYLGIVASVTVLLVVVALQDRTVPTSATTDTQVEATPTAIAPIRIAAVGDSVTEGNSNDFSAGDVGNLSWVDHLGGGITFTTGWADGGATTQVMADAVAPYDADVLVILAGTNDSGQHLPFETTAANLTAIVQKSGVPKVIVSSIPPRDADRQIPVEFNANLAAFVDAQGWLFVDAAAGLRTGDDTYAPGLTADGVHPTADGADILGAAMRDAILATR